MADNAALCCSSTFLINELSRPRFLCSVTHRLELRLVCLVVAISLCTPQVYSASYVVAASNSPQWAISKADVVCTGENDQDVLSKSLTLGFYSTVEYDGTVFAFSRCCIGHTC